MIRSRAKLRWQFIVPSRLPMSYACRFVGLESWGDMDSFLIGVLKSLTFAGRPVLGDLSIHLTLRSSSNHVTCMIINCSSHGYIRLCLLHLGTFFYSLFLFYPWGWPKCVSTILNYTMFTPVLNYGSLYKHVILFISKLESLHHAFLWKNINNDTLNTSRRNATTIDLCACWYCFYYR